MAPSCPDAYDTYYPVALKLRGRRVVIIGGGDEAARKAAGVLACHADLVVVAAEPGGDLVRLAEAGRLRLVARPYQRGDLDGAFLAIACEADDAEAIRAEATERGVLLNVLDRAEACDFIAMAGFARDGLQVSVHSSGKSAALSRRVAEKLAGQVGPGYADLTELLGRVRPIVHRMIPTAETRRAFWLDFVNAEFLDRVETSGVTEDLEEEILGRARAFGLAVHAESNGGESGDHDAES